MAVVSSRRRNASSRTAAVVVAAVLLALPAGCGKDLDTTYGRRRSELGTGSVNGVSALAELFKQRGARIVTWRRLSPKLMASDVIVWAPDSYAPPTQEEREWLEEWLAQDDRTLVYIGRDFDAAPHYWRAARQSAPPAQVEELMRREAAARAVFDRRRAALQDGEGEGWLVLRRGAAPQRVTDFTGAWREVADPAQGEIYVGAYFDPAPQPPVRYSWESANEFEILLATADGRPLIMRITNDDWGDSQVLVVANGSFLLNAPLVNHEHRKLAARLVDECGPAGRVTILESGPGGLPIWSSEGGASFQNGWEAFTVYPLGVVLMHLALIGILYCFARFPIFGRPRELRPTGVSDFGRHVTALGKLLELSGMADQARTRIAHYHAQVKRESGASHRPS